MQSGSNETIISPLVTNCPDRTPRRRRLDVRPFSGFGSFVSPAEKESDDVTLPQESNRSSLFRAHTSTRTAISRLFSAQQPSTPSSRHLSFSNQTNPAFSYARNSTTGVPSLSTHLHDRGLVEGCHSDITVIAFGTRYSLHRILLDRAPFFSSALSPPWLEASAKEVILHPEDADVNITQRTFELALRRLYGCHDPAEEEPERFGLLATGSWLEMQDLIDDSVAAILRTLHIGSLSHAIQMMSASCYGKAGDKVLTASNLILGREGSRLPARYWDNIPAEVIREVFANDGFFVQTEFERWRLAKDVLNSRLRSVALATGVPPKGSKLARPPRQLRKHLGRLSTYYTQDSDSESDTVVSDRFKIWLRLYTHPDVQPLLSLLDDGIYYVHLEYEQLQEIKAARDYFGLPLLPEKIISDALWGSLELRQRIVNADEQNPELGLAKSSVPTLPTTFLRMNASPIEAPTDDSLSPTSSPERIPRHSVDSDPANSPQKHWIPSQDCNIAFGPGKRSPAYPATNERSRAYRKSFPGDSATQAHTSSSESLDKDHSTSFTRIPPFRFAAEFPRPQSLRDRRRVYSENFFYAGSYWNIYIQKLPPSSRNHKRSRLGFYLHRVKDSANGTDIVNSVDERINALEQGMLHRSSDRPWSSYGATDARSHSRSAFGGGMIDSDHDEATAHIRAAMQALMSRPNRIPEIQAAPSATSVLYDEDGDILDDSPPNLRSSPRAQQPRSSLATGDPTKRTPTLPTYLDARPAVNAYFKIFSPSIDGRFLYMYQSVPSEFNFSQSWGWKSSSLIATCDEDDLGYNVGMGGGIWDDDDDGIAGASRKLAKLEVDVNNDGNGVETDREKEKEMEGAFSSGEGKLRFIVVLGVV